MTKDVQKESVLTDIRYLRLLARSFPTIADASTEIINLEAILNLPKGTEHFLSDLHGEDQAFRHVLKNASGAVKRKVNEIFGISMREAEKKELCTLIYYPEEKLELVQKVLSGNSNESVATKAGMNPGQLHQWVYRYKIFGYNGLVDKKKGRKPKEGSEMKRSTDPKPLSESEREELIRLRAENEYIKAENEVIKKEIALREERRAAQLKAKKQRSSKSSGKKD